MLADEPQVDPNNLLFRLRTDRRPVAPAFMADATIAILIQDGLTATLMAAEQNEQADGSVVYAARYRVHSLNDLPVTTLVWHADDAAVPVAGI